MKKKSLVLLLTLAISFSLVSCSRDTYENVQDDRSVNSTSISTTDQDSSEKVDQITSVEADTTQTLEDQNQADDAKHNNTTDTSEQTTSNSSLDTVRQQELLDLFESSEGKGWLFDYFFGVAEKETPISTPSESQQEWNELQPNEKAEYIKSYLSQSDWLSTQGPNCTVKIQEHVLSDYTDLKSKPAAEVITFLTTEKNFTDENWLLLYEQGFDDTARKAVQELANATFSTESTQDTASEDTKVDVSGKGYEWLSTKIQSNPDIQTKLWSELSDEDQIVLLNTFLDSETGKTALNQYFSEHPEALKSAADKAAYHKEVLKHYLPFLFGGAAFFVLVIVICIAFIAILMKKQASQTQVAPVTTSNIQTSTHGKYTMNPELKKLFENSPVYPVKVPENSKKQPTPQPSTETSRPSYAPPITPTPHIATQPKPISASVDGYYTVSKDSVESARIHLDIPLVLVKASDIPTDPPVPYVHYNDHTVGLNMDYYARVGGHLNGAQNLRAWEALMDATVQITKSFRLMTSSGEVIANPSGAAGRKIQRIDRAKLNTDGSIAVPGQIIFE